MKEKVFKTEADDWNLESVCEDDPKLTKPLGTYKRQVKVDPEELQRLKDTKNNGGLLKERWKWQNGVSTLEKIIISKVKSSNPPGVTIGLNGKN